MSSRLSGFLRISAVLAAGAMMTFAADAAVIRVSAADFHATAGLITFENFNAINPVYTPADYGGGAGSPTVYTGGYFTGQSISADPGTDCPGAAPTACIVGNPTGPLSLDPASPHVFVTGDGSNPTSPVLSGSPQFDGPIAVLFSEDQYGVGFDGGYFNGIASTGITAFARDGTLLGTVVNTGLGIEFLGLVTDNGTPSIAGVFLDLVGSEPAGFAIDNLRFAEPGQISVPGEISVPEPASWALMLSGFGLVGAMARRRRTLPMAA